MSMKTKDLSVVTVHIFPIVNEMHMTVIIIKKSL